MNLNRRQLGWLALAVLLVVVSAAAITLSGCGSSPAPEETAPQLRPSAEPAQKPQAEGKFPPGMDAEGR